MVSNEHNRFLSFFDRTTIKTFVLTVFPIITSLFTSWFFYLISDKNNKTKLIISVGAFSLITVFYVFLLVHYAKEEKYNKNLSKLLEMQNKSSEKAVLSICGICKKTAESFNTFSHSIIDENKIDLNIWCFDIMAMQICNAVYDIISEVSGTKDIDVTYTKLVDETKNKIQTIGFRNMNLIKPNIYRKVRSFDEDDSTLYFDAKIFKNNNPEIIVFDNSDDISKNFFIKDRKNYDNKYTQYIAIPIICNDNKIIGVLQVVSQNGAVIGNNKQEIYDIATKLLLQFASLSLLLSKSEKELLSITNLKVNKRSSD